MQMKLKFNCLLYRIPVYTQILGKPGNANDNNITSLLYKIIKLNKMTM
jgi:hypothetical protein